MAGANSAPKAGIPTISTNTSNRTIPSMGAMTLTAAAAVSEIVIGATGLRRSASRPANGESPPSMAEAARNVPAIRMAEAPRRASRSGASTSNTPNAIPASMVSHRPARTCRFLSAGHISCSPCRDDSGAPLIRTAMPMRRAPATAAATNVGPVPTSLATAPTTGPKSAPTTAAPSAMPSSSPRRSAGALVASQARPAAQVQAPPRPCTKRAASSTSALEAQPKANVDTLMRNSPSTTTARQPRRLVSIPPGSAPTSVPSA